MGLSRRTLAVLLLAMPASVPGQERVHPDPTGTGNERVVPAEPIVVTLSALPFPLSLAPGSVTIIDRAAIVGSRAATLADVLRSASFVDLSRTGGRGGLTTITFRGGDPNFTLVLLDGVPLNDPTNLLGGSFDFSTMSADQIERVEIVRGPLSSRFGSEAMAGVVHVVSRRGRDAPGWSAEGAAGSFGAREARLSSQGSWGMLDYAAGSSWIAVDEQVEGDLQRLATVALTAGLTGRAGEARLASRLHDAEARGFPENGGGPRFSILRETKRTSARELVLGLALRRVVRPGWWVAATADTYHRTGDSRTPPILDGDPPGPLALPSLEQETDLARSRLGMSTGWELPRRFHVVASAEIRRESGESEGLIAGEVPVGFELERTTRAAAGELAWRSERVVLDLTLRVDDPEGFDVEASPRAAITWLPPSGSRLAASWGEGFKLPSFFALGEPNIGNPDLRPERSRGFDVSIAQELAGSDLVFTLTGFRQRYRDLVDFSPEAFRLVNRRLSRSHGLEAEAVWRPRPKLSLTVHARWLEARLLGTDEPLRDRPRWRGGLVLDWTEGETSTRLEAVWVGERFDFQIPVPERRTAGAYGTASFALSHRLLDALTIWVRIDDLFDREYEEFVGFPAPGRSARLGLRYGS